jgi:hypothetical protein
VDIITLPPGAPICCCGPPPVAGCCDFQQERAIRMTVVAPGCDIDGATATNTTSGGSQFYWYTTLVVGQWGGDCYANEFGDPSLQLHLQCIDGKYQFHMFQYNDEGEAIHQVYAAPVSVQCEPFRVVFKVSSPGCCVGTVLTFIFEKA